MRHAQKQAYAKNALTKCPEKKESVIALSTGNVVGLNDEIENGEEYSITPEIESA